MATPVLKIPINNKEAAIRTFSFPQVDYPVNERAMLSNCHFFVDRYFKRGNGALLSCLYVNNTDLGHGRIHANRMLLKRREVRGYFFV